jgi:hypothetical protein
MQTRNWSTPMVAVILVVLAGLPGRSAAQEPSALQKLPRSADGRPDLQGVWHRVVHRRDSGVVRGAVSERYREPCCEEAACLSRLR